MRLSFWIVIAFLLTAKSWSQSDTLSVKMKDTIVAAKAIVPKTWNTDPLSPAKAAFYSAILPGLGQAYNNDNELQRYRTAYKQRLDGRTDDEFYQGRTDGNPRLSTDALRRAQDLYQRNKEMSMLFAIGFYALNIIEANVDAHLKQFNVDENLAIEPFMQQDIYRVSYVGLSLTYNF